MWNVNKYLIKYIYYSYNCNNIIYKLISQCLVQI